MRCIFNVYRLFWESKSSNKYSQFNQFTSNHSGNSSIYQATEPFNQFSHNHWILSKILISIEDRNTWIINFMHENDAILGTSKSHILCALKWWIKNLFPVQVPDLPTLIISKFHERQIKLSSWRIYGRLSDCGWNISLTKNADRMRIKAWLK